MMYLLHNIQNCYLAFLCILTEYLFIFKSFLLIGYHPRDFEVHPIIVLTSFEGMMEVIWGRCHWRILLNHDCYSPILEIARNVTEGRGLLKIAPLRYSDFFFWWAPSSAVALAKYAARNLVIRYIFWDRFYKPNV